MSWLAGIIKPLADAAPLSIGIASGSSILIGRNLVGGVQPDVSQPISPPALAPPPVQSRVCPGYRIERTELGADRRRCGDNDNDRHGQRHRSDLCRAGLTSGYRG